MRNTYRLMTCVPESLRGPVEVAASRSLITVSTLLRQALSEKLKREGLLPSEGPTTRVYLEDRQQADAA